MRSTVSKTLPKFQIPWGDWGIETTLVLDGQEYTCSFTEAQYHIQSKTTNFGVNISQEQRFLKRPRWYILMWGGKREGFGNFGTEYDASVYRDTFNEAMEHAFSFLTTMVKKESQ